jgi:hypothetical protein
MEASAALMSALTSRSGLRGAAEAAILAGLERASRGEGGGGGHIGSGVGAMGKKRRLHAFFEVWRFPAQDARHRNAVSWGAS